ncbi:MAG: OmpA family protein [Terriglobales bacterium]
MSSVVVAQQPAPKVDIFGGYSWMHPGDFDGLHLPSVSKGFGIASTFNLNRWFGLTVDSDAHYGSFYNLSTVTGGPRLKLRQERFEPFVEALFGIHRISIGGVGSDTRVGFVTGGGIDLPLAQHFGLRLFQADYVWGHHDISPVIPGTENMSGARIRTGLLFSFGGFGPPPAPLGAACSINPASIMAGEPVTMTATASNVPKNHTVTYNFNSTGGKATPKDNTVAVDTTGLAPGQYTVNATVTDPKAKKGVPATCNASFTVQAPPQHPPTVSCSANPSTLQAGQPSTITATGQSPDNRPLTYNFTSSSGRISPSGALATLDTAGASAGPINVTCTATDDRGLSGSGNTSVNVEALPQKPSASKLNEIQFKSKTKPARVDNEAKAILDEVALRLQREPDSKAVVVGNFQQGEKNGQRIAEERAVNTKAYLTKEKGIDPSRIEVRTGTAGTRTAEIWLVPAGATFDQPGAQSFSEAKVKPSRDAYPHVRAAKTKAKKAPAKKAAPTK